MNQAYRHLPRKLYDDVKDYLNDLIVNGWIQESSSLYASPLVYVRKKDGTLCLLPVDSPSAGLVRWFTWAKVLFYLGHSQSVSFVEGAFVESTLQFQHRGRCSSGLEFHSG